MSKFTATIAATEIARRGLPKPRPLPAVVGSTQEAFQASGATLKAKAGKAKPSQKFFDWLEAQAEQATESTPAPEASVSDKPRKVGRPRSTTKHTLLRNAASALRFSLYHEGTKVTYAEACRMVGTRPAKSTDPADQAILAVEPTADQIADAEGIIARYEAAKEAANA